MDKGSDAFRTISEVAEDLDLPQHVLRFWETRFKQIKPMKRGGGRRYYRPVDIDLLRGIKGLLYDEGYTIRGVQRLLKEHGNRVAIEFAQTGQIGIADPASGFEAEPEPQPAKSISQHNQTIAANKQNGLLGRLASAATGSRSASSSQEPLSSADMDILKSTLQDLLECKRLLDQTRQN